MVTATTASARRSRSKTFEELPMRTLVIGLLCLGSTACGPDFTPQEEIDRLRVLGVKSEVDGQPEVAWPGVVDDARLTALVTNESLSDPTTFGYAWRICPVAFGSEADFRCAFTEEEFEAFLLDQLAGVPRDELIEAIVEQILPDGTEEEKQQLRDALNDAFDQIPDLVDVDFDLPTPTTSTTAVLNLRGVFFGGGLDDLPFDPDPFVAPLLQGLLAGACEQLQTADFPDFVERPECNGTFQVRIDLTVCNPGVECTADSVPSSDGDGPPDVVKTLRFLDVIYDDEVVPNRNPEVQTVCRGGASDEPPPECAELGTVVPPDQAAGLPFGANVPFELADLETDDAETHLAVVETETGTTTEERRERLAVSWFVTGGELDRNRTAFDPQRPENSPIERARFNVWSTPRQIDLSPEEEDATFAIFMVVRDGRGGRAFVQRTAQFVAPSTGR
jgi:hypothetical protein